MNNFRKNYKLMNIHKNMNRSSSLEPLRKTFSVLAVLFIVAFFGSLSLVDAENIGTFPVGSPVEVTNYCANSGTCTYANLSSIKYPNSTMLYIGESMTKNGDNFNYTFNNADVIGEYTFVTCSNPDGTAKCDSDTFKITANGVDQTTSQSIGSLAFLLLMIILMFTFGVVGFKLLKHQSLWVLGIFLLFFSVLLLIYNTWLGYEYHRLLTGLTDSSVPEIIFYIFLAILVLGLLVGVALLFLNWKKVFKYIKSELKTKDKEDKDVEDWDIESLAGGQGKQ